MHHNITIRAGCLPTPRTSKQLIHARIHSDKVHFQFRSWKESKNGGGGDGGGGGDVALALARTGLGLGFGLQVCVW